jgi:hypothetical protein
MISRLQQIEVMNQTVFNKSSLIEAFIEARRKDHPHKDFEDYHKKLLEVLQQAFGLELSMKGVQKSGVMAIWFLFSQTVDSYLRLNARSSLLDGSLMESQIERLADSGLSLNAKRTNLHELNKQSSRMHLELLNEIFDVLWKMPEKTVTVQDLNMLGFDLEKPEIQNYWDRF